MRRGYTLLGWAFDSNATVPANDNTKHGATVHFADNDTMHAVWTPGAAFNEITNNVNVLSKDCYRSPEGFETKTPDLKSGNLTNVVQVARTYEQITGVNAQLHFFPLAIRYQPMMNLTVLSGGTRSSPGQGPCTMRLHPKS